MIQIPSDVTVSTIFAMAQNRVIGKNNQLPWHIPEDLAYFKNTTRGRPVIMGMKTYESLGKPLPGRMNIVLSRKERSISGVTCVQSADQSIKVAMNAPQSQAQKEIFVIGGAEIFLLCLPYIQRAYITLIHKDFDGDVFLPHFEKDFQIISQRDVTLPVPHSYLVYERKKKGSP